MQKMQNWFRAGAHGFSGSLLFDEPLSRHTYYRIGGPALIYAAPKSEADLQWLFRGIRETGVSHFVLGAGSNLLVADEGFSGLIIRAGRLNLQIEELPSSGRIRIGGSVAVSALLRRAAAEGWGGLELLTGIPGTMGGVIAMNAGTHLGEAKDRVRRVEAFVLGGGSLERVVCEGEQLRFEYRRNLFLPEGSLVWSVDWEVSKDDPAAVKARIDETLARRKTSQPIELPSCGSVFKNPRASGLRAWEVIERLGLRGHQIGGAQFSEKHPNFIVNLGGATAADVGALIELAKSRARAELGVEIEEEVLRVGGLL
ncbi:UDP-N-acetylmuramate dehydrogenase [Bdellovibrionota bacterium FG-1]